MKHAHNSSVVRQVFRPASALTGLLMASTLIALNVGCQSTLPDREARLPRGYVYYLDGAGGGKSSSWSRGVRNGFIDAGYPGAGEIFVWQTGLGVVVDQNSTVGYKRGKAKKLVERIKTYQSEYPQGSVTLVGLSAGTAVTVFTLESLASEQQVDDAVLLGSSVSADYDLTRALQHVRHRMYVFTSEQDAVLKFLVPLSGTADRAKGRTRSAGLRGFEMPPSPAPEVRQQYAKVVHIRWRPEFRKEGHRGGHTDVVNPRFVRAHIAPLVMKDMVTAEGVGVAAPAGMVRNPDYEQWSAFAVGSWVEIDGVQTIEGESRPVRIKAMLVRKTPDKLIVDRTYEWLDDKDEDTDRVQQFIADAWIKPEAHPLTYPDAVKADAQTTHVEIAGKTYACHVRTINTDADFPDWGQDLQCQVSVSNKIPGGLVRLHIKARKQGRPFEFDGKVVNLRSIPAK